MKNNQLTKKELITRRIKMIIALISIMIACILFVFCALTWSNTFSIYYNGGTIEDLINNFGIGLGYLVLSIISFFIFISIGYRED